MVKQTDKVVALLDGDIIAVRSAAIFTAQGGWEEDHLHLVINKTIREWVTGSQADDYRICMSKGRSFRYEAYPQYKSNRKAEKPRGTDEAKAYLRRWDCLEWDGLEADDILGIFSTDPTTEDVRIVVSTDKDMLQLPVYQYNPDKDRFPHKPTLEEANKALMLQWSCGDPGDGYPGIPKFGPSRFEKWYTQGAPIFYLYEQHGQTKEHCEAMGKCARLLRWEDKPEGLTWETPKPEANTDDTPF